MYLSFFYFSVLNILIILGCSIFFRFFSTKFLSYFTVFSLIICLLEVSGLLEINVNYFGKILKLYNLNIVQGESQIFAISLLSAFLIYMINNLREENFSRKELLYAIIYLISGLASLYSNNLIDLFILSEAMILSSAALIFIGPHQKSQKAAINYFIIHLISGITLLLGIILFNKTQNVFILNNLNFDLNDPRFFSDSLNLSKFLIFISFLINSAAFPFCFWPAKYYSKATNNIMIILIANTSKIAIFSLLTYGAGLKYLLPIGIGTIFYALISSLLTNNLTKSICYIMVSKLGQILIDISQINIDTSHHFSREISLNILFSMIIYSVVIIINGSIIKKYGSQKFPLLRASLANLNLKSFIYLFCLIKIVNFGNSEPVIEKYSPYFLNLNYIILILKLLLGIKFINYLYIENWEKYQILLFIDRKKKKTENIFKKINLIFSGFCQKSWQNLSGFSKEFLANHVEFRKYIFSNISQSFEDLVEKERRTIFSLNKEIKIVILILSVVILLYKA